MLAFVKSRLVSKNALFVVVGFGILIVSLLSYFTLFQYERYNPIDLDLQVKQGIEIKQLRRKLDKLKKEQEQRLIGLNRREQSIGKREMALTALVKNGTSLPERQDRIYCMVPTMYTASKLDQLSAVIQTWGKRCDVIKFFVDPPFDGEVIPEFFVDSVTGIKVPLVVVPMVRKNDFPDENGNYRTKGCWGGGRTVSGEEVYMPCRHIWEKVWRSWVYVAENDLHLAEWFFKVDDDSYLLPHFIKKFVQYKGWTHEDPHYFGHVLHSGSRIKTGFVSGVMVGLSRRTIELVTPVYLAMPKEYGDRSKFQHGRCVDRDGATQELTESICLSSIGIIAESTADGNGMERVSLHPLSADFTLRKREGTSYFFWKKRSATALCCSAEPLAFHSFKKPRMLLELDPLLFDPNNQELMERFSHYEDTKKVLRRERGKTSRNHIYHGVRQSRLEEFLEQMYLLTVREKIIHEGWMDKPADLGANHVI